MILIYRILTLIVIFFLPLISIYRIFKKKETFQSINQKIGFYSKNPKNNLIWFHGSSVGELLSVVPLIQELEKNKNRIIASIFGIIAIGFVVLIALLIF